MVKKTEELKRIFPAISLSEIESSSSFRYEKLNISIFQDWLSEEEATILLKPLTKTKFNNKFNDLQFNLECKKFIKLYEWIFENYDIYFVDTYDFDRGKNSDIYKIYKIENVQHFRGLYEKSLNDIEKFQLLLPEIELIYFSGYDFTDTIMFNNKELIHSIIEELKANNLHLLY